MSEPGRERHDAPDAPPERARRVGTLLLLLATGLFVVNAAGVLRSCRKWRSPVPGMPAPAFGLRALDGKIVELSALRGKVVVLDFWASWCPPCVEKFPLLARLQEAHAARGLQVLAINTEGDDARIRAFVGRHRLADAGIVTLLDDGRASGAYGVTTIPHVVVVGRDGRIVHVHIGAGGEAGLRDRVALALGRR